MRILVLVDDAADLEFVGHPEKIRPLDPPGAHRDLAFIMPQLDPRRVQLQMLALSGGSSSLDVRLHLDPKAIRRFVRYLRQHDIELIHALSPGTALYAALAGRISGLPTLASLYNMFPTRPPNAIHAGSLYLSQAVLRWGIDRLVLPSALLRQNVWQIRYPRPRIEVVYPGVPIRSPDTPILSRETLGLPAGPLAVMIAPLVEDQGYNTLLAAIPRLLTRVPDAHIVVYGKGPLLLHLQQEAHRLPLQWLSETGDVRDIIAASDAVLLHPRLDSLPMAALEAAAAAKPVVGSRVAGVSEIVEQGITGLLVTYADARDFAIQIGRLLLQPAFRRDLGQAAQKRARERFSIEAQRDTMTTLYETTIYAKR